MGMAPIDIDGPNALHEDACTGMSLRSPPYLRVEDRGPYTMTRDQLPDDSISSTDEFESVLAEVMESAIEAEIDVRGAWEIRTQSTTYDLEIEIIELARSLDDDE